jgi:hypothetical protein
MQPQQLRQPRQIVGGDEGEGPSDALAAAELGSLLARDGLGPAEGLLDPFANALAHTGTLSVDGKIVKLTFSIAPLVLTEDDQKQEAYRAAQDANRAAGATERNANRWPIR